MKNNLRAVFRFIKRLGKAIVHSYFNADAAFDNKAARSRKRLFNPDVYKLPFTSERTFAWIDQFRTLLVR